MTGYIKSVLLFGLLEAFFFLTQLEAFFLTQKTLHICSFCSVRGKQIVSNYKLIYIINEVFKVIFLYILLIFIYLLLYLIYFSYIIDERRFYKISYYLSFSYKILNL
jgi:hypothetical protein